jgi:hypothetical protein
MKYVLSRIVWLLVALLVILHQDYWFWHETKLWLGLPTGLTYHIGLSLAAAVVWWLACVFAWPDDLETLEPAQQDATEGGVQ